MSIPRDRVLQEASVTKPAPPEGPELETGAIVGLRVLTTGDILPLIGRDNFTLGRASEGQAVIPDIDLGGYNAFDSGVSRMHAEVLLEEDGVYVVDLESANGTLVNGKKLEPQHVAPVRHGDVIQLGRLRLQLISRYRG
ncbi:MAG TPA: FHA domain-containing protein [Anaerolineales bacterium]|nr:FHA domain-containing protein [Anaerolineales bacterium]